MKRVLMVCMAMGVLFFPAMAGAVDLNTIRRGDVYYLDRLFDDSLVVVLEKGNERVKVQYRNGTQDWVRPSRLRTQRNSDIEKSTVRGIGLLLFFAGIYCATNPDACKGSP